MRPADGRRMEARAVLFDLDGTLTRPFLDFARIRADVGLPEPLLESMLALPDGPERRRAFDILERHETEAAERSELNDGARELLERLSSRLPVGLVTRNSRRSTVRTLEKHGLAFSGIMTRDDGPTKPDPHPILELCRRFGVPPAEAVMVGDFRLDVQAGRAAGTRTVLITNGRPASWIADVRPDHVIHRLDEMPALIGPA